VPGDELRIPILFYGAYSADDLQAVASRMSSQDDDDDAELIVSCVL